MYSNMIPSSDLDVVDGKLSLVECTLLCGNNMTCQTSFYKPNDGSCFLYKYPLLNNTPVSIESDVEVYEIKGCRNPDFVLFREAGICLKMFTTTGLTFSYATSVCDQEGGELVSLDTNQKIDALAYYLIYTYGMNLKVSIGLRRLSGSWKWNNGESLSITHPMLSSSINN
eukprot:XP_019928869.1 PREDICTED: uncharacterized protein LOC109620579 [Crassostrea gigas]